MTDARKRIAELEEALRPFAAEAGEWSDHAKDSDNVYSASAEDELPTLTTYTVGDLRRAALLLSEQTETPVEESASARPDNCQSRLMDEGKPYPRTCQICGLGPCPYKNRTYSAETPGEETGDVEYTVWHSATEHPQIEEGTERYFIVAVRRQHNGKVYSFPALFLNTYPLRYEECRCADPTVHDENECACPMTGWYTARSCNEDYDSLYEPLSLGPGDIFEGWREVPDWNRRAAMRPAPEQEAGDVDYETAWKKIADYVERHWQGAGAEPGGDWLLDEIVSRSHALDDLEDKVDALSAMRPVSVDREKLKDPSAVLVNMMRGAIAKARPGSLHKLYTQEELLSALNIDREKLAEIRARHEEWKRYRETDRGVRTQSAHVDLEWLLSVLEGVNHDAD